MELNLNELDQLAEGAQSWAVADAWANPDDEDQDIQLPTWIVGTIEDGVHFDVVIVDCDQYSTPGESEKLAKFYAAANPAVVLELVRRLRDAETDVGRLNFLERRQLEIDSSGGWNEEPTFGVTRVSGGRNDRKWTCLARGETLREAIDASMQPAKMGIDSPPPNTKPGAL